MIRHGSSSTNRHLCRTRCAGRSLMPAAPRRATISTVMTIAVITAAWRSNGPCCGRGGFADAGRPCGLLRPGTASRLGPAGWPPLARRTTSPPAAAADPQAVPAAGRPPAASAGQTPLSSDAAAASRETVVRASAEMQPLQPSTAHDDAFHE